MTTPIYPKIKKSGHNLPAGYTELQYIKNAPNVYLNTGIKATANTWFKVHGYVSPNSLGGSDCGYWLSGRTAANKNAIELWDNTDSWYTVARGNLSETKSTSLIDSSYTDWSVDATWELTDGKIYVTIPAGKFLVKDCSSATFDTGITYADIYMFARNNNGTLDRYDTNNMHLFSAQIGDGENERNFVPCKNPSNVVGLYDTINGQFYSSQGSGSFIAGPELSGYDNIVSIKKKNPNSHNLPSGYTELESVTVPTSADIRIPTTEWMSGYIWTLDMKFAASSGRTLFGYNTASTGGYFGKNVSGKLEVGPSMFIEVDATTRHIITFDINQSRNIVSAEGLSASRTSISMTGDVSYFGAMPSYKGEYTMYSCSCKNSSNDTIVNIYPARRNSDNVVGYYDLANNTFIEPTTGTLTAGPEFPQYSEVTALYKKNSAIHDLPSGYTELEYIESSGAQRIDTGLKGTQNTKYELDFQYGGTTASNGWLFGARTAATNSSLGIWCSSSALSSPWRVGFDNTSGYTGGAPDFQRHIINTSKDGVYIDGTKVYTPTGYTDFTTQNNLQLFACYGASNIEGYAPAKMWYAKIWENNTLVRHFIPAKNSSDEVGMYDIVNDVFYPNLVTATTFMAGPEVTKYTKIFQKASS